MIEAQQSNKSRLQKKSNCIKLAVSSYLLPASNNTMHPQHGALLSLAVLSLVGLTTFVVYFVQAFPNGGGKSYEYSSPLSAMWPGIGLMWYNVAFLIWFGLTVRNKTKLTTEEAVEEHVEPSAFALKVWLGLGVLFASEGFLSMIGWAIAGNESAAAGLSLFWIPSGFLSSYVCYVGICDASTHLRSEERSNCTEEGRQQVDPENREPTLDKKGSKETSSMDDPRYSQRSTCKRCCRFHCTCKFWIDFSMLFLVFVLMMFTTGYMVQSFFSASDASLSVPGSIYTVRANDTNLKMHLYCFGSKGDPSSATVVFEHGGGSNFLALLAIAREISSAHGNRVCLYDRLGYGFTPTLYASSGGYESPDRLPNSGQLLSQLLDVAGETAPFVCAGHSAGAEACLWFAMERRGDVTGVAMMDGYPDIIRAGSFRPGQSADSGILSIIQASAVMVGTTALLHGLLGDPGPNFVPREEKGTYSALYGQSRFWFSQYWDVNGDLDLEEKHRLYNQLGGVKIEDGLIDYNNGLAGVNVLVMPAYSTVTPTDCSDPKNAIAYCCGHAINSTTCKNERLDSELYLKQAVLYTTTLNTNNTVTEVKISPEGAEHDYVYQSDYYEWAALQIVDNLLS